MKDKRFEYFEITENSQLPTIELKMADEFIKLAEELKNRFIFYTSCDNETSNDYFLFLYDKLFYRIRRNGYLTLSDYSDALENGFPSAADFYKARQGNFMTYKEFKDCSETGITDRSLYQKAKKLGFVDNFAPLMDRIKEKPQLLPADFSVEVFINAVAVCEFASSKGFKDYGDFQKAFFLGFMDRFLYEDAQKKGFTYASDYIKAVQMGFDLSREYQEAVFLKIESKAEFLRYKQLKALSQDKYAFDEAELIEKLRHQESGKKLSLSKINVLLDEILDTNQTKVLANGKKAIPEWYTRKLTERDKLKTFLTDNKALERFGIFDPEGEYYQSSPLSSKTIYLDGSNVAFAANGDRHARPRYSNILLAIQKLKELRYSEIIIIADASLRHRAEDISSFEKVKKEANYLEVPSNTSADEFLFSKIKSDKCYLVTNDTFKDWKMKDTWVAQHIDQIRVPFMISDGVVSLPALEREKQLAS